MEGIMMRGPKKTALAVRNPRGEIVLEESETRGAKRPKICKLPIIRGIFGYIDSMVIGYKALMRSAEISGLDDIVEKKPEKENASYYQRHDASRRAPVPEIRVPKRVDSTDGSVHFEEDSDGYSNATIE